MRHVIAKILNVLVFQWLFIRLWVMDFNDENGDFHKTEYAVARWIIPLTGIFDKHKYMTIGELNLECVKKYNFVTEVKK